MSSTATHTPRVRHRPSELGYWCDDEFREGFPDDPSLPDGLRRRIAGWARAFTPDALTSEQHALLRAAPNPESTPAQRHAAEAASPQASPLWSFLSDEEKALVRNPALHAELEGDDVRYPLSIGELTVLTGTTERQIRHWHQLGLLPVRVSQGGRRRFYSAAVIRAFVFRRMPPSFLTVLHRVRQREARPFMAAMATLWGDVASEEREEIAVLRTSIAEALARVTTLLDELPPGRHPEPDTELRLLTTALSAPPTTVTSPKKTAKSVSASHSGSRVHHVRPAPGGGWMVVRSTGKPLTKTTTQREAKKAATVFAKKAGGGTIVVHGRDGRERERHSVSGPVAGAKRKPARPGGKRGTLASH